jgi:hypothetical protein
MVVVLRFFLHQVEDLSDACSHKSGSIVVFQKALPTKFIVGIMQTAELGGFVHAQPYFLSDRLVSEGVLRSSVGC